MGKKIPHILKGQIWVKKTILFMPRWHSCGAFIQAAIIIF
jgi:hypothetical protein